MLLSPSGIFSKSYRRENQQNVYFYNRYHHLYGKSEYSNGCNAHFNVFPFPLSFFPFFVVFIFFIFFISCSFSFIISLIYIFCFREESLGMQKMLSTSMNTLHSDLDTTRSSIDNLNLMSGNVTMKVNTIEFCK